MPSRSVKHLLGVGADPATVDVRRGHGDAVLHDGRERRARPGPSSRSARRPRATTSATDFGVAGCGVRMPETLARELAAVDIDRRALDAGATDVDTHHDALAQALTSGLGAEPTVLCRPCRLPRSWSKDWHSAKVRAGTKAGCGSPTCTTHVVHTFDPATGALGSVVELDGAPSGLGWDPHGALLIVSMDDRRLLRLPAAGGPLEEVADLSVVHRPPDQRHGRERVRHGVHRLVRVRPPRRRHAREHRDARASTRTARTASPPTTWRSRTGW